jgi:hypothetical protein
MENIGDGESVRKTGVLDTVEPLRPLPPNEKRRTKKTEKPITPGEAVELLTSALSYCLGAGLIVSGYNEGQSLLLSIDGVQYVDGKIQVTLDSVTNGVTL